MITACSQSAAPAWQGPTITAVVAIIGIVITQLWQARNAVRALKFGQLHKDRVTVMVEIYDKLFNLRQDLWLYLKRMRNVTENVPQQREEGYRAIKKQMDDVHSYYRRRRFYFNKAMYEKMDRVFAQHYKIEEIIYPHHMSDVLINVMAVESDARKSMRADLDDAFKILREELQQAMDALESAMRGILEVEPGAEVS